jgi:pyruvate-formate lyase
MNERVARLRTQSLDAVPAISAERAVLITEFYRDHLGTMPAPILRARAFAHVLEHKAICINDGELIVGERGPAPKVTPTYPEICCHTLEDLDILAEFERIAEVCRHVPAHAPRDFHEALQAYWFVHLGVITELNPWDAFNPGHLDQHLCRSTAPASDEGTLTEERPESLLQCFWIKFNNQPAPPKVGVTAAESGTYTDFANINTGGVKPDGTTASTRSPT